MNITYLESEKNKKLLNSINKNLFYFLSFFNLCVLVYFLALPFSWFNKILPFLTNHLESHNFLSRLYAAFIITQFVSFFIPSQTTEKKGIAVYKYSKNLVLGKVAIFIVLGFVYWLIYY
jgi:hypothetical protein